METELISIFQGIHEIANRCYIMRTCVVCLSKLKNIFCERSVDIGSFLQEAVEEGGSCSRNAGYVILAF